MRLMTCSIGTPTADDGDDHWERQRALCVSVILEREPDIRVFCRGNVEVKGAETVKDSEDGRSPIDPYIITADCEVAGC